MTNQYSKDIWHPFSHPTAVDAQIDPIHIVSADGVYVKDDQGRELLDGTAGGLWCVNVGQSRPEMKKAITNQLDEMAFYHMFGGASHPRSTELAAKLVNMAKPENMKRVFFTSGGSDSVENALKIARQYHVLNGEPDRKKFISLKCSYHGTHFGGTSLHGGDKGGVRRNYEPLLGGCIKVEAPWLYRNPWHCDDPEQLVDSCINQLIAEIEFNASDTIAALIAEPVMGGSLIIPPESYWPRLREVCDQYGILLIADEVITGFGRSGCLFGSRGWGVAPDIMTLAKGISSGYIPLGAVMINERIEQAWETNNDARGFISSGITYSGHPVACAAGLAALDIVEKENLSKNAKIQGDYLLEKLKPFAEKFPSVGDVRGKGLMLGLELVADKKTRQPVDVAKGLALNIAAAARKHGALVRPAGQRILLAPHLIYTTSHCDQLVDALSKAFNEIDR